MNNVVKYLNKLYIILLYDKICNKNYDTALFY